jgi:RNA polymerase sigma-70 factor, ECF subfamily
MTDSTFSETYDRLIRLARRMHGVHDSLDPSDIVHEVYLKLAGGSWTSPAHLRAVAARAMRSVIIDRARARGAHKRGGPDRVRVSLAGLAATDTAVDLIELSDAIDRLAAYDAELGQIAELKLFMGLEVAEIAEDLGCSAATIKRRWKVARAWLITSLITE